MEYIILIISKIKVAIIPAGASLLRDAYQIATKNAKISALNMLIVAVFAGFLVVVLTELIPESEWKAPIMFGVGFFARSIFDFLEDSKNELVEKAEKIRDNFLK